MRVLLYSMQHGGIYPDFDDACRWGAALCAVVCPALSRIEHDAVLDLSATSRLVMAAKSYYGEI